MKNTKEEILRVIGNSYRYSSEGFLIDHDILADNILMLYDLLKAHLTDKIKSMDEENIRISNEWAKQEIKLESLQKELNTTLEKWIVDVDALNSTQSQLTTNEAKLKEYEEVIKEIVKDDSQEIPNWVISKLKTLTN